MPGKKVRIVSRSGKQLCETQAGSTVDQVKQQVAAAFPQWGPERQYYTTTVGGSKVALRDGKKRLSEYGVKGEDEIVFKDLGPQVGWRTVFIVEYMGPLLVFPLVYFCPQFFYADTAPPKTWLQTVALCLVFLHYCKREYETMFVHRFSHGTMPLRNIVKNSIHYWVFGGFAIAYFLFHPHYTQHVSDTTVSVLAFLMLVCMGLNYESHAILRDLRPPGSTKRAIPHGSLFEYVSCPNYLTEIAEWTLFACMTCTLTAAVFALFSAGQMWIWAVQKHQRYRREFNGTDGKPVYPRHRRVLVPFLL